MSPSRIARRGKATTELCGFQSQFHDVRLFVFRLHVPLEVCKRPVAARAETGVDAFAKASFALDGVVGTDALFADSVVFGRYLLFEEIALAAQPVSFAVTPAESMAAGAVNHYCKFTLFAGMRYQCGWNGKVTAADDAHLARQRNTLIRKFAVIEGHAAVLLS